MKKIIEIKDLYFAYDKNIVLENVNLYINKGDYVTFIGPNGSGKSTLVKLILYFLKTKKGIINILGQNINQFKEWTKIAYISQDVKDFNQSFPATVREIIACNLYQEMGLFKLFTKKLDKRIENTLKAVDMLKYKNSLIGTLSGGEKQRVFIARTLVINPVIIILDEPLVGVDIQAQKGFYQLINKLNKEMGITIIMITHDPHFLEQANHRIFYFSNTKVKELNYGQYQQQVVKTKSC